MRIVHHSMPEFGLFRRRQVWVPTWRGWGLLIGVPVLVVVLVLFTAYDFLSLQEPRESGFLVVEGWMDRRQLRTSADIFRSGKYDAVVVTGGPLSQGSYLSELYPNMTSTAEVGARQLRDQGVVQVHAVPRRSVVKDRTYFSALALRMWFAERGRRATTVDVVSKGPHARRSWLLYRSALDGVAEVGAISLEPVSYDPDRWWQSSPGVRTVVSEMLAYAYAKFLFYPNPKRDVKFLKEE